MVGSKDYANDVGEETNQTPNRRANLVETSKRNRKLLVIGPSQTTKNEGRY